MAKAVMMCGIAGSGKTTRACELEAQGFVRLSVDETIWNRYSLPVFTSMPVDKQRSVTSLVEHELLQQMQQLLSEGKDVVFDSTMCRRSKRDTFRQMVVEAGGEPILEYLEADLETLRQRLRKRDGHPGPNAFPVSDDDLNRFFKGFQRPDEDELNKL